MFLWNSIWTMFMWNSSRLLVPCKSFEIMKSKGGGFWYQAWEADFNSQDFSAWLWEGKTQLTPRNSRYENSLLLTPEPVTLVSSLPQIWKCAELLEAFSNTLKKQASGANTQSLLSVLQHEVEALDDQQVCYTLCNRADPGQWCPACAPCAVPFSACCHSMFLRGTCLQTRWPKANVLCMVSFS